MRKVQVLCFIEGKRQPVLEYRSLRSAMQMISGSVVNDRSNFLISRTSLLSQLSDDIWIVAGFAATNEFETVSIFAVKYAPQPP